MTRLLLYTHPSGIAHDSGPGHPEAPVRLKAILKAVEEAAIPGLVQREAPEASLVQIARVHPELYSSRILRSVPERGYVRIDADTVISPASGEAALRAAGAACAAVDAVLGGEAPAAFCAMRPPGHHAELMEAMGFCLFNNVAIAARYAQVHYGADRVLIVDWDVHHGNGTQEIFYRDPSVFYLSAHQYPYYPGTGAASERGLDKGEGTTLNIPLSEGTSADAHRSAFSDALRIIEKNFPPDLIIISAGFDSRRGDPLGGLMLEDSDFAEMTKLVMDMADRNGSGRVVSVLEGGYNLDTLGETVRTHVAALAS